MMTMATTREGTLPDRVDRAVAGVRAAVGRLIPLLCEEDAATFAKAAEAMMKIGPFAVGPLATALERAESPRDRRVILGALVTFGAAVRAPVMRALNAAMKRERGPNLRAAISEA